MPAVQSGDPTSDDDAPARRSEPWPGSARRRRRCQPRGASEFDGASKRETAAWLSASNGRTVGRSSLRTTAAARERTPLTAEEGSKVAPFRAEPATVTAEARVPKRTAEASNVVCRTPEANSAD